MAPSSPSLITAALSLYDTHKHIDMGTFDRAQFTCQSLRKDSLGWSVENDNLHILPPWTFLSFYAKPHFRRNSAKQRKTGTQKVFRFRSSEGFKNHPYRQNYSLCYSYRSYFSPRSCRNTSVVQRTHNITIYMQEKSQSMD